MLSMNHDSQTRRVKIAGAIIAVCLMAIAGVVVVQDVMTGGNKSGKHVALAKRVDRGENPTMLQRLDAVSDVFYNSKIVMDLPSSTNLNPNNVQHTLMTQNIAASSAERTVLAMGSVSAQCTTPGTNQNGKFILMFLKIKNKDNGSFLAARPGGIASGGEWLTAHVIDEFTLAPNVNYEVIAVYRAYCGAGSSFARIGHGDWGNGRVILLIS